MMHVRRTDTSDVGAASLRSVVSPNPKADPECSRPPEGEQVRGAGIGRLQRFTERVDTRLMPETRTLKPGRTETGRLVPVVYAATVLAVFVTTVAVIAVKAGTSSAIVTGVVTVTVAGTAFGLWGAAVAVRDTHDPTRVPPGEDGPQDTRTEVMVGEPR